MLLLLRSAELVAVGSGSGAAAKDAPDEPAGHPVRHEPYRQHDRSKNYRGIMDARSAAGDGGAALAARPQCGLLTGEAFGAPDGLRRRICSDRSQCSERQHISELFTLSVFTGVADDGGKDRNVS